MKLLATMMTMATAVLAAGRTPQPTLRVCLDTAGRATVLDPARATASRVFGKAGIRIEWRITEAACAAGAGIVVMVVSTAAVNVSSDALAYALPYERTHLVLLWDRLSTAAPPAEVAGLIGYVLVHEIGHMLEGVSRHSASGIMKAHWDSKDRADMRTGHLRFAAEDLDMILAGLTRFGAAESEN